MDCFAAIPEQLASLPIQDSKFTLFAVGIFKSVGEFEGKLRDEFEGLSPRIALEQLALVGTISHLGDLAFVPLTVVCFPREVRDLGWLEHGQ